MRSSVLAAMRSACARSTSGHDQRKVELESALAKVTILLHTPCSSIHQRAHCA